MIDNTNSKGEEKEFISELKFNDLNVTITSNVEESKSHIKNDYDVIQKNGLDKIMLEKFMPWFKGNKYADRDDQKVLEGLKLYEVTYKYKKVCAEYSPTGEDDYFGTFEFCFESGNEYTKDMLEAVAMEVFIHNSEVVKVRSYDI